MRNNWLPERRDGESLQEYAQRLHDERHGPSCTCLGNPGLRRGRQELLPEPFRSLDTVPEGKRVEVSGEQEKHAEP
jgi:hypothetical protein